jgi:predicted RNA binding protein YcfA (HicA-like mRNA interferase family)
MNGREVLRRLKAEGWSVDRVRGSHHILLKGERMVSVPVHGSRDLTPGTLAAIQRQTGVKFV